MLLLLHLVVIFLLVGLGFYVFVAGPRQRANQTFALFITFLATWAVKDLIFWEFLKTSSWAAVWISASFIIGLLMQFSLVNFAWVFPENHRTPKKKAAILFAPAFVLIPAAALGWLTRSVDVLPDRLRIDFTPLAHTLSIFIYVAFFYGLFVLVKKYRLHLNTEKGQQIGAIIWAISITAILQTIVSVALPMQGYFGLLPWSSLFVLPGVLIFAYAILNFRLFSFRSVLDQFRLFPVAYKIALSIATIAVFSFVLLQVPIVWWSFKNGMDTEAWRRYIVFSLISALVPNLLLVLLVLRVLSRPLKKITIAAVEVSKGSYGAEVDLRKTNDEIGLLAESFNKMSRKMSNDIDEMKLLNRQLLHSEKLAAMGSVSAGLAHELSAPLTEISVRVQELRARDGLSVDARQLLTIIAAEIDRVHKLTLEMSKLAASHPEVYESVDIASAIDDAVKLVTLDDAFDRIDILRDLQEDISPLRGDSRRIVQVLTNILFNARDAMPLGGEISISAFTQDDQVIIEISDTGDGVSPVIAEKIFDPFFSTHPSGKRSGLGLSVCYSIVNAHNGTLDHRPNFPTGSTFSIKLPDLSS